MLITKRITRRTSTGGETMAVGHSKEDVLKTGVLHCGNGDTHLLLKSELAQIERSTEDIIVLKPGGLRICPKQSS